MSTPEIPLQPLKDRIAWMLGLGIPLLFLLMLPYTKDLFILLGFGVLTVLLLSCFSTFRLFLLIALLPLAHAGFGVKGMGGFGLYDVYNGLFLLIFTLLVVQDFESFWEMPVFKTALIMMAAFVPSLLQSVSLAESLKAFIQLLASILTAGGVYYFLRRATIPQLPHLLLRFFVITAAVVAAYGIYEAYAAGSVLKILTGRAYFSLFQDVNYYSSYLLMALPIGIGLTLTEKSNSSKIIFATSSLLLVATIISTVSRSAIAVTIIVIAGFALYLFVSEAGGKKLLGVAILIMFTAVMGVLVFTNVGGMLVDLFTLSRRVETVLAGRDASLDQRITILNVSMRIIEDHPVVGIGFGAFEKTFDSFQGSNLSTGFGRSAHNTFVRMFAETGLLGLLAGLGFVVALMRYLIRGVRSTQPGREQVLLYSVLMSMSSFLLMSLTLDLLFEPHFWVMIGLSITLCQRVREGQTILPAGMK